MAERAATARATIKAVLDLAACGEVDGFSDISELPDDARGALEAVRAGAPDIARIARRPEPTFMAIPVDLNDPIQRDHFVAFAPYAIHAEVLDGEGRTLLHLDDASSSIAISVPESALERILQRLPAGAVTTRLR